MADGAATIAAIFGTSFVVGLSGAMSPGPLLAFDVREAARIGFRAGPFISLGHSLLEAAVVVVLAVGLSRLLQRDPVIASVALLGGGVLLWMGWGILRNPSKGAPVMAASSAAPGPSAGGPVLGGVLVSLSNPYWAVWWLTVGATYMVWARQLGAVGLASFYTGHILSDFAWFSLVSLAVASGRRFIGAGAYRGIMMVCGLSLWAMAGYFIYTGVGLLVRMGGG